MAKISKFIDLHDTIVEAHDREWFVAEEGPLALARMYFEQNFTVFEHKTFNTNFYMTPEERRARYEGQGTSDYIASIVQDNEKWDKECEQLSQILHDIKSGKALDKMNFQEMEVDLAVHRKFIDTTSVSIRAEEVELRFSGNAKRVREMTSWAVEFGGSINLGNILKTMEFISRLKGFVVKTIKEAYGEEAAKSFETGMNGKINFGFSFDLFKAFEVLKTLEVNYEETDGAGEFTIKFSLEKLYALFMKSGEKTKRAEESNMVRRQIFKKVSVLLYQALDTIDWIENSDL